MWQISAFCSPCCLKIARCDRYLHSDLSRMYKKYTMLTTQLLSYEVCTYPISNMKWKGQSVTQLTKLTEQAHDSNENNALLSPPWIRDSLLVKAADSWSFEFESQRERWENFLLNLQWHVKDPVHSAKSAGGRLHLNMHAPLTKQSWCGLIMPLSRHSWESIRKWAHMQLVREHLVTIVSARWATVDWSWPKEWN